MATQFKHNYREFGSEAITKRVRQMLAFRDQVDVENAHVKFSYDNRKTGALVPSVSLIPVADCGNCAMCRKGCYDVRNVCFQKTVQKSRANNSAIYHKDPAKYFGDIRAAARFCRFFRWHVGGDIVDFDYLIEMVRIAGEIPTCEFLAFTKNYEVVNRYLDEGKVFPQNLHIILSGWRMDMPVNKHNLPISSPVWPDGSQSCMVTANATWCMGDCSACAEINGGCWGAKKGDTILFEAH